jgi:protein-S-isoprenylcysteine O-methyltransferase Ste14
MDDRTLLRASLEGLAQLTLAMVLFIFLPAWTLRYWQAWAFLAVFVGCTLAITRYLYRHDRALLERRLHAGPGAERRKRQQIIQAFTSLAFLASLVVPAIDHRLGWSHLPPAAAIAGDALVALGFWVIFRVFKVNSFTASTVQVEAAQTVITTGPYAVVRHPMYAGALLLFVGIPLALGSLWGLVPSLAVAIALVVRLFDEEKLLVQELPGYAAYRQQTRRRLIPFVW